MLLAQEKARADAYRKVETWIDALIADYRIARCSAKVLTARVEAALELGDWAVPLTAQDCSAFRLKMRTAVAVLDVKPRRSRTGNPSLLHQLVPYLTKQGYTAKEIAECIRKDTGLSVSLRSISRLRAK